MDVLFLTPPGISPADTPWMGVPQVLAYIEATTAHRCSQRDLDLELFEWTLRGGGLDAALATLDARRSAMDASAPLWKRLAVRLLARPALRLLAWRALRGREHFLRFRAATPIDRPFPEEGQARYRRTLHAVLELYGALYFPNLAYPRFHRRSAERVYRAIHLRLGSYLDETMGLGDEVLAAFYRERVVPDVLERAPALIGVSVSVKYQYGAALVLARVLREAGCDARLVLGGSFVTNSHDSGWLDDDVVAAFDHVVRHEGERTLAELLDRIEAGEAPADVPNLVQVRDGERTETPRAYLPEIESLPPPDYRGLPLELYLDRPLRLSIMGNRGCYWGKCTFCAHFWSLGTGRMRLRSAERQLADMVTLNERHGVGTFHFVDEAIEPREAARLARLISVRGHGFQWGGMMRIEDSLSRERLAELRAGGCYVLLFGLESINERIQRLVQKGVEIPTVWRVLRDCRRMGIKVHLFMILGLPSETEDELRENVRFMVENTELFDTLQVTTFELFKKAPMERRPEEFGIQDPHVAGGHLREAYNVLEFDNASGLSRAEVQAWKRRVERMPAIRDHDFYAGRGYRLFHPDRPPTAECLGIVAARDGGDERAGSERLQESL